LKLKIQNKSEGEINRETDEFELIKNKNYKVKFKKINFNVNIKIKGKKIVYIYFFILYLIEVLIFFIIKLYALCLHNLYLKFILK
jgi:hypothetical protein